MAVPFGKPLNELYGRLLDVGIRGHWMNVHNEWSTEAKIRTSSRVHEITRAMTVVKGGQLRISDPLLLESLCVLGVGILGATVTLVVAEVLRNACFLTYSL